jgi:carbonic anhydrase
VEGSVDRIRRGVQHFRNQVFPAHQTLFQQLDEGQSPAVLFITCSDSRVDPSLITSSPPGVLFVLRNAGNLIPSSSHPIGGEAATLDYAVRVLKVRHIVVCGHSRCGAMSHLMAEHSGPRPHPVDRWLEHAHPVLQETRRQFPTHRGEALVQAAIFLNALAQLKSLRTWPAVARAEAAGTLQLHAWVYEIHSGEVLAHDAQKSAFVPLEEASWEAPLIDDLRTWTATLHAVGPHRATVIDAVQRITSWSLEDIRPLLTDPPQTLLQGLSHLEAEVVQSWLEEAGATLTLERESG